VISGAEPRPGPGALVRSNAAGATRVGKRRWQLTAFSPPRWPGGEALFRRRWSARARTAFAAKRESFGAAPRRQAEGGGSDRLAVSDAAARVFRLGMTRYANVEMVMIARHWRGWTELQNADAYELLLKNKVLPGLESIHGYRGGYVLRSDGPAETEFVVVNLFESLEAVRVFTGPDYSTPVFEPEARGLLSRVEPIANHYEVRANTARR
jgi:hypothetical protein